MWTLRVNEKEVNCVTVSSILLTFWKQCIPVCRLYFSWETVSKSIVVACCRSEGESRFHHTCPWRGGSNDGRHADEEHCDCCQKRTDALNTHTHTPTPRHTHTCTNSIKIFILTRADIMQTCRYRCIHLYRHPHRQTSCQTSNTVLFEHLWTQDSIPAGKSTWYVLRL